MRAPALPPREVDPRRVAELAAGIEAGDVRACCATVFADPAVRWLLDDQLHPGGERLTAEMLGMVAPGREEQLLDVASGAGTTALLAAREHGCEVVGIDYSGEAVAGAQAAAREAGHGERVAFVTGDAEALPFAEASFDVVVCECALCTFAGKAEALAEMRRVLRPGGRLALSDVVADHEHLPGDLRGTLATVACIGGAVRAGEYERLLAGAGFEVFSRVEAAADVEAMVDRVRDRLRAARILGLERMVPIEGGLRHAIALAAEARSAVGAGHLGYGVWAARAI